MRTRITTDQAPPPAGPYSQGIRVRDLLFTAGQGPFDVDGHRIGATFEDQVDATIDNLAAVAEAAGSGLEHLVRLGVFVRDMSMFPTLNGHLERRLTPPYPVRTTIPTPLEGFDVEMDGVFWIPEQP